MPHMRIGGSTVLVMSLLATLLLDVACDRAPRGARLTLIGVSDHANEYVSAASDGGMMVARLGRNLRDDGDEHSCGDEQRRR